MEACEILKRPYARVLTPESDGQYTAEIMEFPNCVAFGPSASEALASLEHVAADWIAAALEQGQNIPEPIDNADYSGRLVLRMPRGLHRKAALLAEREGASLNQFIVTCLAEAVGERAKPQAVLHATSVFPAQARMGVQFLELATGITITAASITQVGRAQIPTSGWPFTLPPLRVLELEHA